MHGDDAICPRCAQPRCEAEECPYCGVIYERFDEWSGRILPRRPEVVPEHQPQPQGDLVGTKIRHASGTDFSWLGFTRELVERNLPVAVVVAFALLQFIAAVSARYLIGGSDRPQDAREAFTLAVGMPAPSGFDDGVVFHLVDRRFVLLTSKSQNALLAVYSAKAGSGRIGEDEIADLIHGWYDGMGDVLKREWTEIGVQRGELHGTEVPVHAVRLAGSGKGMWSYYAITREEEHIRAVCLLSNAATARRLALALFGAG